MFNQLFTKLMKSQNNGDISHKIFPQQFIDQGYASRIANGECQVYIYIPLAKNASEREKVMYTKMDNVDEIRDMIHEDGYYVAIAKNAPFDSVGSFSLNPKTQLLVINS